MNWNIEWSEPGQCLGVTLSGLFTHEDAEKVNSAIVEHPSWQMGARILIDERELDLGDLESTDVRMMANRIRKLNDKLGHAQMAILTDTTLQFGIARQFEAMLPSDTTLKVGVFKSPDAASKWLGLPTLDLR